MNPAAKRINCDRCLRPLRNCICSLVNIHNNMIELLILQDKTEAVNAKNTAGLLHLCLKNSQLYKLNSDESMAAAELDRLLFASGKQPLLLYPPTRDAAALGLEMPLPAPDIRQIGPNGLRLVVIDATWRKSRKMLYKNRPLQTLPRLALENPPDSLYLIRKAGNKNQLSTLEASCYALQQLEQDLVDYSALLDSMQRFVTQQLTFRPV